jgi:hypothetical protein
MSLHSLHDLIRHSQPQLQSVGSIQSSRGVYTVSGYAENFGFGVRVPLYLESRVHGILYATVYIPPSYYQAGSIDISDVTPIIEARLEDALENDHEAFVAGQNNIWGYEITLTKPVQHSY